MPKKNKRRAAELNVPRESRQKSPKRRRTSSHSSLMTAIENGDLQTIRRFVSVCGEEINKTYNGQTALIAAVKKGNSKAVGIILEPLEIDVNKPDFNGATPLWQAVYKGNIEIVRLLLKYPKIEVNKPNVFSE
eukprot:121331_1